MVRVSRTLSRQVMHCMLAFVFLIPSGLMAQSHVVAPSDLQNEAISSSQLRQQQIDSVQHLLSTPEAQKAMRDSHVDPTQVKNAVPQLNDQELARLAARADRAQADFAAGHIGTRDLVLIVLGVVVIILIIVIAS